MPGTLPPLVLGLPELCQSGLGQPHLPWCQSQPGSHRCGSATSTSSEEHCLHRPRPRPPRARLCGFRKVPSLSGWAVEMYTFLLAALLPQPGGHLP